MKSELFQLKVRPAGLLIATGSLASLATLAGFAGRWHWLLDLCSHFPCQCALALAASGILLALLKRRRTAALFGVFALVNAARLSPQLLPVTSPPVESASTRTNSLTALLSNVHTENHDFQRIQDLVAARDPDLVVLEEVNAEWMHALASLTNRLPHRIAEPREDNFGIALFTRLPVLEHEVRYFGDAEVPTLVVRVRKGDDDFTVIATHPIPPVGSRRFHLRNGQLMALARYIRTLAGPVVLLGDLNVSPWSPWFRQFERESGLVDSTRGAGLQFSWPTGIPVLAVPIDHCLASPTFRVRTREIGPDIGSDRRPLLVELDRDGSAQRRTGTNRDPLFR